jgi:hypothetical protein
LQSTGRVVSSRCWLIALGLVLIVPRGAGAQAIDLASLLDPGASGFVAPRHAGRPDPRWEAFAWKFTDVPLERGRLRLYFYESERWTGRYALPAIRRQIDELAARFNGYRPSRPFTYVLFSTHRGFGQQNLFAVSEGVQGITSTTEPIMSVPYWGEAETFRHISTHEMTHQFQVQKIADLSGSLAGAAQSGMPLWFIEGMAENYSLGGMDAESRPYLRDLLLYPDPRRGHEMPKLFEDGPLNFIGVYKVGQAKIDFFETKFGTGSAQRILEAAAKNRRARSFAAISAEVLGRSADDLQKEWEAYLSFSYGAPAAKLKQELAEADEVPDVGDTIDHYAISPSGELLAYREVDELTGVASIRLMDLRKGGRRWKLWEEDTPGVASLHFMQNPVIALTDGRIAAIVETAAGPEIAWRKLSRGGEGAVGGEQRVSLHAQGIHEAHSLALSPDGRWAAFVGLASDGRARVHRVPLDGGAVETLTPEPYA